MKGNHIESKQHAVEIIAHCSCIFYHSITHAQICHYTITLKKSITGAEKHEGLAQARPKMCYIRLEYNMLYNKLACVCVTVIWKVGGSILTSRHGMLDLWLLNVRS